MVSYQFIECGILPEHGRRIVGLAKVAERIEATWQGGASADAVEQTCDYLAKQRGVGPWTIGYIRGTAMADSDAVVLGDYGFPRHLAYFFGMDQPDRANDDDMLRLLEPFRPHRFYVLSLIMRTPPPPRRGPRRRPLRHRLGGRPRM